MSNLIWGLLFVSILVIYFVNRATGQPAEPPYRPHSGIDGSGDLDGGDGGGD